MNKLSMIRSQPESFTCALTKCVRKEPVRHLLGKKAIRYEDHSVSQHENLLLQRSLAVN